MGVNTRDVTVATLRAIKSRSGDVFQSQDIRKDIGWDEQSPEGHYVHNVIARLKNQKILKTTGPSRRRNQYLEVADPDGLRRSLERAQRNGTRTATPRAARAAVPTDSQPRGPRRVVYLEERVAQMASDIAEMKERLDSVDQKVTDLVDMWS